MNNSKRKVQTTEASSTSVTPTQVKREQEELREIRQNERQERELLQAEQGGHTSDASTTHYNVNESKLSRTSLTFNGKRYITLREYSKVRGITEWYAQKLCRLGKVNSIKVGSLWFIKKK
jgi:hypothetical protein